MGATHCLIRFGSLGTSLCIIEARDGHHLLVRKCDDKGKPTVKHARRISDAEVLFRFPSLPTREQLKSARWIYRETQMTQEELG